jgi:hypothetical protein
MITNNLSWSLGPTPNKSLEPLAQAVARSLNLEPSIPIHLPGDLHLNGSACLKPGANKTPCPGPAESGDTRRHGTHPAISRDQSASFLPFPNLGCAAATPRCCLKAFLCGPCVPLSVSLVPFIAHRPSPFSPPVTPCNNQL